ncbi:MAG TPA: hypothetical protein VGA92_05545 [Candidatus Nitrosotenuis sp.]|jgi:hypothetical protein
MSNIATILGIFAFFGAFAVFSNFAFAMCAVNEDWPDAPCFDVMPVNREEYRAAWAPYYDYKGSEWMEQKKAEMLDARDNKRPSEWINGSSHYNVYSYYLSRGEIAPVSPYDYPFFEDDFRYYLQFFAPGQGWLFFVMVGVSAGLIAGAAAFVFRRRK